jgi:hypothetical protein
MGKFDSSIGISTKEIGTIKFNIKREIEYQLPELPEPVETTLFLQGKSSWMFTWNILNKSIPVKEKESISIEVVVKLKKEFHCHLNKTHYKYTCIIDRGKDIYHPKVSIVEIVTT